MNKQVINVVGIVIIFCHAQMVSAQYPKVPPEAQKFADSVMQIAGMASQKAWKKAFPVIQEEAKKGKPYIPWAHRPTDLPQADIPAFPGAEGGGMYSFGGRGGKVCVVTSLEDSGPGTFREACEKGGARIVVFNVAGIIRLETPLIIRAPYITIAGQTAPGDGICIAGESVWLNTHDVVIRHMRFRRGETHVGRRDDAVGGNPVGNIMIDHVSASWGLDENMSIYRHMFDPQDGSKPNKYPAVNVTIQNSIFSEALDTYNHSFGSTIGGENCTFVRNLWANNTGRNASNGWNGDFNFINNVIFNWMHRTVDGGNYTNMYNIINNYYKPGPVTPKDHQTGHRILKLEPGRKNPGHMDYGRAYVNGNIMEGYDKITNDNWAGGVQVEDLPDAGPYREYIEWSKPFPMAPVHIMAAEDAYGFVLNNAGAILPVRDPVDIRIFGDVRTGKISYADGLNPDDFYQFKHRRLPKDSYKLGIITDIRQVGGYPEYTGKPYKDSDMDGMPDDWEKKYQLNPSDPTDAVLDCNGDGYSNIEKYINGINPEVKVDWKDLSHNEDTLAEKGGLMN